MDRKLYDIIPPSRRRTMLNNSSPLPEAATPAPRPAAVRKERIRIPRGRFPTGTALVALAVVLLSAAALYLFSKAQVTVYPVERNVTMAGSLVATSGSGLLPFTLITVEKVASKDVKSEGTVNVQQAAQGSITISNNQPTSQQLIKNTRFESADGHIFRIHDSIVVPAGKDGVPGTLAVTVYADAVGDSFNIPATTFKLPGLKGNKAYELVTAKSTEAMSGGFSGPRPSVAQGTKDKEYALLRTELATQIDTAINQKIPEGYVLLKGASFVSYGDQPDAPAAGGEVTLSQKAVATAVVFPREALASSIAGAADGTYGGETVTLIKDSGLTLLSANGAAPLPADQEFLFSLNGEAAVRFIVEANKIAGAVAGKSRQAAEIALTAFPEIEHATIVIRPFWASSFPADPTKIDIVVAEPSKAK